MNHDLDDRLLHPRLGVLLTVINVVRSVKRGAVAGPDPWKANTLEWYTTSPPPEHNFDVDPARALRRADEGHPPPGRAARPAQEQRYAGRPAALAPVTPAPARRIACRARGGLARGTRSTAPRAWAVGGLRQVVADYVDADQAEGPVAAAADDGDDDVRRRATRRSASSR